MKCKLSRKEAKMELTLEKLIEEIKNRREYALDKEKEVPKSLYWEG